MNASKQKKKLAFYEKIRKILNREAKIRFANTSESTDKTQLYKMKKEKEEISLKLAKIRQRLGFDLRPLAI